MAVGPRDRRFGSRSDMREKQRRADIGTERPQVFVGPGRAKFPVQAWGFVFPVPTDAESVAVGFAVAFVSVQRLLKR